MFSKIGAPIANAMPLNAQVGNICRAKISMHYMRSHDTFTAADISLLLPLSRVSRKRMPFRCRWVLGTNSNIRHSFLRSATSWPSALISKFKVSFAFQLLFQTLFLAHAVTLALSPFACPVNKQRCALHTLAFRCKPGHFQMHFPDTSSPIRA